MKQTKNILIVDDDIDLQNAFKHALVNEGYKVRLASSIEECKVELINKIPDIILLDAILPDGNGFEYSKQLYAIEQYKHIGVLLMSGMQISPKQTHEVLSQGALLFTAKPVDIKDLLQKIKLIFNVQEIEQSKLKIEEKYNHFFLNTSDIFFVLNNAGRVINISKSYDEICGIPLTEKIDKDFKDLLVPEFHKLWASNFQKILDNKVIPSFEVALINTYKNAVPVDVLLTKLKQGNTREHAVIGLIKDLRPLKHAKLETQSNDDANKRESASWDLLTGKNTAQTSQTYEVSALSDENSVEFNNMLGAYQDLVDTAIEKRIYKSNTDNKIKQRMFANELGFFKAGPQELIHLHTCCYKKIVAKKNNKKVAFFHEEARIILLTVMGYLVSFYKNRNLQQS